MASCFFSLCEHFGVQCLNRHYKKKPSRSLYWLWTFLSSQLDIDVTHMIYALSGHFCILVVIKRRKAWEVASMRRPLHAYQALVRPHLEYCSHTVKKIGTLEKVRKPAARWLTAKCDSNSKQWDMSYFQSLSELNWQSLQQRRTYINQCQTFKVLNCIDCIQFAKY